MAPAVLVSLALPGYAGKGDEYKPVNGMSTGESFMAGFGNKGRGVGYSVRCIQE
jgi:hypothetical protein